MSDTSTNPSPPEHDGDSKKSTPLQQLSRFHKRLIFCAVISVVAFFLVWPGFTLFASARPFILGLPLPIAWAIICTIVVFLALLMLYRSDHPTTRSK